jgi:NACalpha-BTF3-like transcription factor
MVMEHSKVTKIEAIRALRKVNGDKVQAILNLTGDTQ